MFDCHCHTFCSPDCKSVPQELCFTALEKGLKGIAFTDHCNVNHWPETDVFSIVRESVRNAEEMQKRFEGRLTVLRGVELGNHGFNREIAKQVLKLCDYDMVVGSVHAIKFKEWNQNISRINFEEFPQNLVKEYVNAYFLEILRMISEEDLNVAAHIGFGLRYLACREDRVINISDYMDNIDMALKGMIERSVALEINANDVAPRKEIRGSLLMERDGKMQRVKVQDFDFEIAKRYYALGGRLITLGSDSHAPERVARAFDEIIPRLKEIGFTEGCYFKNRKAVRYDL